MSGFKLLGSSGHTHVPEKQGNLRKGAKYVVPRAGRAMGNLKQWLLGTHHGVGRAHLQAYLDEFVFRHNRRGSPMAAFQTLLGLGTQRVAAPLESIRYGGRPAPVPGGAMSAGRTGPTGWSRR
jgi:hypothetical protein